MSNLQKYTDEVKDWEIAKDFGKTPILLANVTDDKAMVAIIGGLSCFVSTAFFGPVGMLLAGTIALNDYLYLCVDKTTDVDIMNVSTMLNTIDTQTVEVSHQTIIPVEQSIAVKPSVVHMSGKLDSQLAVKPSFSNVTNETKVNLVESKVIESFVPVKEVLNLPQMLADDLYSYAIMSPSGGGKGMVVSNALRLIKQMYPDVHIFLVDPKDDPKERGYWDGVVDTWVRCDFNSMRSQAKTDFIEGAIDKYHSIKGKKILVFDEATNIFGHLKNCAKDLFAELKSFLSGIASSGNSRDNFVWLIGHSGNLGDYGISGGEMSCFRKIYIAPMSNLDAVKQLGNTNFAGGKYGAEGVEYIKMVASQSEVGRAVYVGTIDSWEPMARLHNHSGYDRDSHSYEDNSQTVAKPNTVETKVTLSELTNPTSEDGQALYDRALACSKNASDFDAYNEILGLSQSLNNPETIKRLKQIIMLLPALVA